MVFQYCLFMTLFFYWRYFFSSGYVFFKLCSFFELCPFSSYIFRLNYIFKFIPPHPLTSTSWTCTLARLHWHFTLRYHASSPIIYEEVWYRGISLAIGLTWTINLHKKALNFHDVNLLHVGRLRPLTKNTQIFRREHNSIIKPAVIILNQLWY